MGHMFGGFGAGIWMLLWWLIGLGVLFVVIYGAVYLAVRRALSEAGRPASSEQESAEVETHPPTENQQ